jgi:putative tryptophan/tyrosine transport system substrate-binding protein
LPRARKAISRKESAVTATIGRRSFLATLGGAALLSRPLAARAQQTALPVIGYLSSRSSVAEAPWRAPFFKGLETAGFVPGQNVAIDYRFSEGRDRQLLPLAADFVRSRVAVLVATSRPAALAAKAATTDIPIVFTSGEDPVGIGLVASLNHPGGNATGVSLFTTELGPKRLGLLRELFPKPGLIAFVVDQGNGSTLSQIDEMQAAAKAVAQPLLVINAGTESEVDAAFAAMAQQRANAVLYGASTFFQVVSGRLIALAARQSMPAIYEWREFVAAGGLMSYSTSVAESALQVGIYAGQILKGAIPADLPVVQSTRFEFVINLKTAKALGLEIPPTLLARADEVIE